MEPSSTGRALPPPSPAASKQRMVVTADITMTAAGRSRRDAHRLTTPGGCLHWPPQRSLRINRAAAVSNAGCPSADPNNNHNSCVIQPPLCVFVFDMTLPVLCLLLAPLAQPPASPLPIGEILRRVAENQEKRHRPHPRRLPPSVRTASSARGKLAREEKRQYTVTPPPKAPKRNSSSRGLTRSTQTPPYTDPKFRHRDSTSTANWPNPSRRPRQRQELPRRPQPRHVPSHRHEQRHYTFRFDGYQAVGDVQAIRSPSHPSNARKTPPMTRTAAPGPAPCSSTPMSSSPSQSPPNSAKSTRLVWSSWHQSQTARFKPQYRKVAGGLGFPATYGTEFGLRVLLRLRPYHRHESRKRRLPPNQHRVHHPIRNPLTPTGPLTPGQFS